jgi:tRNA threonylcarbamoyladenosine biosynthesis protein TsaB
VKHPEAAFNILSIESAVADGSIAIARKGLPEIVHTGEGASRAERILSIVQSLIEQSGLSLSDLDLIAVSIGPGSYSGIRIGMSTALGLRDALGVKCVGVPVLTAMAYGSPIQSPLICSIPVGKGDIAWQAFEASASNTPHALSPPRLASASTFSAELTKSTDRVLFAHTEVLARIDDGIPDEIQRVDAGTGLATYVARFAEHIDADTDSLRPIYLRNQEAAARSF